MSLFKAKVHWWDFLADLQPLGLHRIKFIVSDAQGGIIPVLDARLTAWHVTGANFTSMRNALRFVHRPEMQSEVVADLRAVFDAPDRSKAERQLGLVVRKYRAVEPRMTGWLEENVPEGLAIFA